MNQTRRTGWLIVVLLAALYMINFMDKAVIGLAAQKIMRELHITPTQFGGISSSFFLVFIVTSLLGGLLADRFATRHVLLVMAIVWSFAMLPVLLVTNFGGLVLTRVLLGVGEGPTSPVGSHAIFKWFDAKSRVVPQALYSAGPPAAIIVGAPLLTWIIGTWGWRVAFASLGVASLAWAVVWFVFGREGVEPTAVREQAAPPAATGWSGARIYGRTLISRTYIACVCFGFPAYLVLSVMLAWLPSFLTRGMGFTPRQAAWLVSLDWFILGVFPIITGIVSQSMMRRGLSARVGLGFVAGGCVVIAAIAMFLVPRSGGGTPQLVLLLIGCAFPVMITPVLFTILGNVVPSRWRGGVLGSFSAVIVSAGLLGPIMIGYLIQHSGPVEDYFAGFGYMAVVLAVGGMVGLFLIDPDRDRDRLEALSERIRAETGAFVPTTGAPIAVGRRSVF